MAAINERADVRISSDKMSAEIYVNKVSPMPTIMELRTFLASRSILFGIKDELLTVAIQNPETWQKIAEGEPAKSPVHGTVDHHFDITSKPRIAVDDSGTANLKELGLLENVTKGFCLATLHPPQYGAPGRNIHGEIIYPDEPKTAVILPGKNVSLSPDGTELFAEIDGRVVVDRDGRISVENVYTVAGDVGPATGNINFLGTVFVGGKVCSDYRIKAAEKIIVSGAVEGAILEAGQEITVKGGVAGGGAAVLQSSGNIHIKFAQDAKIFCGGTIYVSQDLVRVTAVAGQAVIVENGAIIDGIITAPKIYAAKLGSDSEPHTVVEFGISPRCKLSCARLESEFISIREKLISARRKLQPLQAHYNAGEILTADEKKIMEFLEAETAEFEAQLLNIAGTVREFMNDPASNVEGELKVSGSTYRGVILSTCKQVRAVSKEIKNLSASAVDGKMSGGGDEK